jgi:hypothetical protein
MMYFYKVSSHQNYVTTSCLSNISTFYAFWNFLSLINFKVLIGVIGSLCQRIVVWNQLFLTLSLKKVHDHECGEKCASILDQNMY